MSLTQNSTQTLNYLASIHYAKELQDVGDLCRTLKTHCGLSGLMIQRVQFNGLRFSDPDCRCFGDYVYFHPEYIEEEMFNEDPLISTGLELTTEFNWDRAFSLEHQYSKAIELRQRMRRHGMISGLPTVQRSNSEQNTLLAVHLAATTNQLSDEQAGVFENILPYLVRLSEREWMQDAPKVSLRQLHIAQNLKSGLSRRQTASKLNIPLRAVNFHINRLVDVLKVENIEQALDVLDSHCVF
jgi:DNA-binding CsgD family transcriptional regulator